MNKPLFFLTVLAVSVFSCKSNEPQAETKLKVDALTLKDTTVVVDYEFPATLTGVRDVSIYPQVRGRITAVCVKSGTHVKKGDVLFEVDDVPYKAQYESALAQVEVSKAQLETSELTLRSKENLFAKGIISEYQLKLAQNDVTTAKAVLGQAQAALKIAENNLSFTKVRTSGDGYVGSLPFKVGSLVGPEMSDPLTVVSDNSYIIANFSISENVYLQLLEESGEGEVSGDTPVKLLTSLGKLFENEGKINSMSAIISGTTGSVPVTAKFHNKEGKLLSGGACKVVISSENTGIAIPRTAIKEIQNKLFVFLIKDGALVQTEIEAVRIDNRLWGLLPNADGSYPLKAGDRITATTNRLYDGAQVEVTK